MTIAVDVRLPHWVRPVEAPADVVPPWDAYQRALILHEQGHVDRAGAALPTVEDAIRTATCATAEGAAQAAVEELQDDQDAYDAATDHGRTQGAVFGPG